MANGLHIYLRELRMENGELLKDMAARMKMSPFELSAIENRKKEMPEGFMDKIQGLYENKSQTAFVQNEPGGQTRIFDYIQ